MRLARDFGTVRELFPDGIDDLRELPHNVFENIQHAMFYLSFEELPEEERPPKRIWRDSDRLKEWFAEVKRLRAAAVNPDSAIADRPIDDPKSNEVKLLSKD